MRQFIDVTGKTEDEAIQNALRQLGLDRDDVSVEILERAKSGFLGLGSCPAKVRVSYEVPGEDEEQIAIPYGDYLFTVIRMENKTIGTVRVTAQEKQEEDAE